ncbi:MAG TPA: type II toxin-antitoxin system VapC family toxin [Acidobacteriaceae bacterium]|nr:type II toxin-antitoxin system VapC family toxin [Acidobacteriaceae bacterium]
MTPRYVLDTNICIYIRRHQPPQVLARFQRLKPGEAVVSVITGGELLYGAEKSQHRARAMQQLEELFTFIPVMPLPTAAAHTYGSMRKQLETRGEMIGNNDLWIAAHAKAAELILVTNNEREFKRVPGLKVQNWTL